MCRENFYIDKNMSTICAGLVNERPTNPTNNSVARKAVAEVRKIEAGKGVTEREDMEKAFPPVLSNLYFVVVAGFGPVEKCRARGQQAAASGAFTSVLAFVK